jgi:tRNA G18 (ribose-2'-O)-methylase SpoU
MLTRCPNPECRHEFEVPNDRAGKNGPCPNCGQVITFRSLDVLRQVERQQQRLAQGTSSAPAGEPERFSALLEDVRSLWNVGSVFRTADGAGFGRLYLCGITGYPPRKEIAKTSLGAEDVIAWEHHTGALEVLPLLKRRGVQVVGLEKAAGAIPLTQALTKGLLHPPLCLVLGNEVAGLSAETLGACEVLCDLPMRGVKGSLNVAVSFGIAAYRLADSL